MMGLGWWFFGGGGGGGCIDDDDDDAFLIGVGTDEEADDVISVLL